MSTAKFSTSKKQGKTSSRRDGATGRYAQTKTSSTVKRTRVSDVTVNTSGPGALAATGKSIGLTKKKLPALIEEIEKGFPYSCITKLQRHLRLPQEDMAEIIQIKDRTLARRKREGRLHSDESERVLRIARIFELALSLFDDEEQQAVRWLTSPKRALAQMTPLEFAKTEIGSREVEALIGRLEHGVF